MSEEHRAPSGREHETMLRYTILMNPTWCGWQQKIVLFGTASNLSGGELLIMEEGGRFHSINYAQVRFMSVEPMPDHK